MVDITRLQGRFQKTESEIQQQHIKPYAYLSFYLDWSEDRSESGHSKGNLVKKSRERDCF